MKIENEDCYVAFLDIQGFKHLVKTREPEYILKVFKLIQSTENSILRDKIFYEDHDSEEKYNSLSSSLFYYIMSDSIVLAIKSSVEEGFHFLAKWCCEIQVRLFREYNILLRGGISKGCFYGEGHISFGKGMVNAHELESKGGAFKIFLDHSLYYLTDKKPKLPFLNVNWKNEEDRIYIDWVPYIISSDSVYKDLMSFCKEEIEKAQGKNDVKLIEKYEWLKKSAEEQYELVDNWVDSDFIIPDEITADEE